MVLLYFWDHFCSHSAIFASNSFCLGDGGQDAKEMNQLGRFHVLLKAVRVTRILQSPLAGTIQHTIIGAAHGIHDSSEVGNMAVKVCFCLMKYSTAIFTGRIGDGSFFTVRLSCRRARFWRVGPKDCQKW